MIQTFNLPTPPPQPITKGYPEFRNWLQIYSDRVLNYFYGWQRDLSNQFNTLLNGYGQDIPATGNITVTNQIHRVVSAGIISTINQPAPNGTTVVGPLTLVSQNGFSMNTQGNILNPVTVPPNTSVSLAFNPNTNKWAVNGGGLSVLTVASTQSPFSVPVMPNTFVAASAGASADTVINLPPTTGSQDIVTVKRIDNNYPHNIVVTPAGSDTVDGLTPSSSPPMYQGTLAVQYQSITVLDYKMGQWLIF